MRMTIAQDIPSKDLPYWMRQARRGVDWGVLLVIAFCLSISWPFVLQPGLPHSSASVNYVYRTNDYAEAFQEGRFYPRWSPHVFSGYGAPIPHYYPPGAPYSAALVQVLFTDEPVTAVRIIYIAALCLCGSMVYVFVTRRAGSAAGVLAAVVYITSPYVGLTSPHILGDLPGMISMALIPMLLWAVDRLLLLNRPPDLAFVAFSTAALLLTSPRDSIVGLGLALLYTGWHVIVNDRHASWRTVVIGCALGLGLATFYWLPAWMEQGAVSWRAPARVSTLQLTPDGLFAPVKQIDLGEMNPTAQLTLGLVGIVSFMGSGGGIIFAGRRASFQGLFLAAGALLIALALIAFPAEIWLLGPISLCIAIGSSVLPHLCSLLSLRWQRLFLPALLIVVLIGSLPVWLAPQWSETFGGTTPQAQIQYEQQGYGVAVLPPDAPIPATIPTDLPPNRALTDGYQTGDINKMSLGQIQPIVRVGLLAHQTHSDRFQLRVTAPTSLELLTAYFPGWMANIGGRPTLLVANEETGLIHIEVPVVANEELDVTLGTTPIRAGAWIISGAVLGILLMVTWGRWRRQPGYYDDLELLSKPEARLLALVLGSFASIILLFATPVSPLSLRARPGYLLDNSYSLRSRTDVGLEAVAYRLDRFHYHPGETLELTLYWQTLRVLLQDYQIKLYLVSNANGVQWLPTDFRRPGNYPTLRWNINRYIEDRASIPLSLTIFPGNYQIAAEVYGCNPACSLDSRVNFFDPDGRLLGRTLILPPIITILAE
jgi:hypothetical protein